MVTVALLFLFINFIHSTYYAKITIYAGVQQKVQVFSMCAHRRLRSARASTHKQLGSQNAEKIKLIKGRLLDQAVILSIFVPSQNGNFS